MNTNGREHFEWDTLVPCMVHPVKVAVVEAMHWIDEPISPRELDTVLDEEYGVSLVAYHVRVLANMGAVEKVGQQAVRGALQTFYVLAAKEPANPALARE